MFNCFAFSPQVWYYEGECAESAGCVGRWQTHPHGRSQRESQVSYRVGVANTYMYMNGWV